MLEDALLIWKLNRGDKSALASIYEKYKDDLVTLAAVLLNQKGQAEDTVHDVFVAFIKSGQKFRLTGSLKAYLATCVANNARNRNKAGQRHTNVDLEQIEPVESNSKGPDSLAILAEQQKRLADALGKLSYEQKETVMLHIYTGMKFKAIAKMQDVSINTAQGRYRYGLDKLRSLLNSEVQK